MGKSGGSELANFQMFADELWTASQRDWHDVEPAIFGTLLERALDERERAKLGAHYTPRAYVERLVIPTIMEPLRSDWEEALAHAHALEVADDRDSALRTIKDFHHKLCTTRVLDPACGTGNFLYVSLELMKRLEGEVLDALDDLGEDAPRFVMEGETVGPRQFHGLEINPRAVAIADLVLWIGYLKWQLRTVSAERIAEPVLQAYGTIREQDAILAYDKRELLRDESGKPLTRWDGFTTKLHPITGEEIPDPDANVERYRYENPRPAEWPEAEFVVGNPPFIGGKDMRVELGDGYAEACWKARAKIPGGADFVMHFWDEAASRLLRKPKKGQVNPLRRFGFITTNSATQTFSRRVVERHARAKEPMSLVYAVPDHPWLKASGKAAVRIAMTVAERERFPKVYQHVVERVKPEGDNNRRQYRRENWWLFGENIPIAREYLFSVPKYISTVETSKHRFFQFLDAGIRPDNMLVCIGSDAAGLLAVLSSRSNVCWSIEAGGWLGMGNDPRYSKSRTFDPMPFPILEEPGSAGETLARLGDLLDSFRKQRLAEHEFLTMTSLYNVLERERELENGCDVPPLSEVEQDIHDAGLVSVLKEIHDDVDRAVLEAYGWPDLIPALVGRPGATMPSPHKTAEQEEAEEALLSRLVALNRERAEEERRGVVRWLRPDYQVPKLGHKVKRPEDGEQIEADLLMPEPVAGKPAWPGDEMERIRVVRDILGRAAAPLAVESLSAAFRGRGSASRERGVERVLRTLVAAGVAQERIDRPEAGSQFFIPR